MPKVILNIKGMSCSACSSGLEKYLNKQEEIVNATVNLVLQQATIEYSNNITIDNLNKFIKDAGFESLGIYNPKQETKKESKIISLITFGLLSLLIIYISMSHMLDLPAIPLLDIEKNPLNYSLCLLLLTIPFLIYGYPILKRGYKNIIHKNPNMDSLVSIGVLASLLYSLYGIIMIINGQYNYSKNLYFESICIVIYFIKLGKAIDINSKEKTKSAIKELVTMTPDYTILKTIDGCRKVTIDEIKRGDILISKPGMKIAVDGVIITGTAHIDESFITGESLPSKKQTNMPVIAGSINLDGYIEYKAEKIGKSSTISEIVRLVINASNTKAPISKIADKVCSIFVPSIILISLITFISYIISGFTVNIALEHFVTTLVVACPCALGLATPLAIVISEGLCAKNGILVKTSETLENAHKINTIVFDKTGTLTYGNIKINKIYNYSTYSNKKLLAIVSSLENKSTHPISTAFKDVKKLFTVEKFKNLEGLGITGLINNKNYYIGNGKILEKLKIKNSHFDEEQKLKLTAHSIVYVIEDKKIIGLIGVKDILRKNARKVIKELKLMNKDVIMLTGDNELTAKAIATEVGINNVIANVYPKDKANKIKELVSRNKKVMMIGDGINDAPSLASANIGLSLSNATDIATSSSDVILMNNNLESIIDLFIISKKTITNIKQNLFWAFFYNICMIPIATGIIPKVNINPMIASIAMTLSSITVIINALRLRKTKVWRDKNV